MEELYATIEIENNHSHVPRDNSPLDHFGSTIHNHDSNITRVYFSIFWLIDYHDNMEAN